MTLVYFWHEREQITVSDLLINGRVFRCDSVVALIEKEAEIANMASHLRQVLESAKHWSDREVIPLNRSIQHSSSKLFSPPAAGRGRRYGQAD